MQFYRIPLSLIDSLRCGQCNRFLSCGPIQVIPGNDLTVCGRCQPITQTYRNYPLEVLLNNFLFPCTNWNNNCPTLLKWNESKSHEENCSYKGCMTICCSQPTTMMNSGRQIPQEGTAMFSVNDTQIDQLLCYVCSKYLSANPVFLRNDGRSICHRCNTMNGIQEDSIRNYLYEKLGQRFVFPCIYKNRGCGSRFLYGKENWDHEANCPYGQVQQNNVVYKKLKDGKERGVIQTHTGHIFGTITPNHPLFAPPKGNQQPMNKDLIKSLQMKQQKKRNKINEEFINHSRETSYDGSDGRNTPSVHEDPQPPKQTYQNYGYEPEHEPYRPKIPMTNEGQYWGSVPPPVPPKPYANHGLTNDGQFWGYSPTPTNLSPRPSFNNQNRVPQINRDMYYPRSNLQYAHSFYSDRPSYQTPHHNNLQHNQSFNYQNANVVQRNNSISLANPILMRELRQKQQQKHLGPDEPVSPYLQCNSLQDLQRVQNNFDR